MEEDVEGEYGRKRKEGWKRRKVNNRWRAERERVKGEGDRWREGKCYIAETGKDAINGSEGRSRWGQGGEGEKGHETEGREGGSKGKKKLWGRMLKGRARVGEGREIKMTQLWRSEEGENRREEEEKGKERGKETGKSHIGKRNRKGK